MDVKISYTVPFDEVPSRIQSLLVENRIKTEEVVDRINEIHVNAENLITTINRIDSIRKILFRVDTQLADCYNILIGYNKAKADLLASKEEETNAINVDNDTQRG
jgi:hypothetical protein